MKKIKILESFIFEILELIIKLDFIQANSKKDWDMKKLERELLSVVSRQCIDEGN